MWRRYPVRMPQTQAPSAVSPSRQRLFSVVAWSTLAFNVMVILGGVDGVLNLLRELGQLLLEANLAVGLADLVQPISVQRGNGAHLHAGRLQVHDQQREPPAAAIGAAGTAQKPQVVHVLGIALPALLSGHHVVLALPFGAAAQARQVRAGLRLGVAEGEVELAAPDRRQPAVLLLLGAEARDGPGAEAVVHADRDAQGRPRR